MKLANLAFIVIVDIRLPEVLVHTWDGALGFVGVGIINGAKRVGVLFFLFFE